MAVGNDERKMKGNADGVAPKYWYVELYML